MTQVELKKTIKIDPRIFINPPYIKCPKCKKDSYGTLMVNSFNYTRRCKECWFTETYKLPPLKKKVIYLDQFAISEMMKAVNLKLGKSKMVNKFWLMLFEKLEILTKSQLIVCPDSNFHQEESLLYLYKPLKRMYEHFSNGVSFFDSATIRRFQIDEYFRKVELKESPSKLTSSDVLQGGIDEWQTHFLISFDFKISDKEINSLRESRENVYESIAKIFRRWNTEKNKKFNDWFKEEGLASGNLIVQRYIQQVLKWQLFASGKMQLSIDDSMALVLNEESLIISNLLKYMPKGEKRTDEENLCKIFSFLASEAMIEVPFNHIRASLWAALAQQAAHGGRKNPPNIGMCNDIEMVSTLLPYCDAMFVDNEIASLLSQGAANRNIQKKYRTEIFSPSNKNGFIKYLDEIKNNASKEHMTKVYEVYGDGWQQPFYDMFETNK